MERATGFEPAILGLGSRCCTTQLRPRAAILAGPERGLPGISRVIAHGQPLAIWCGKVHPARCPRSVRMTLRTATAVMTATVALVGCAASRHESTRSSEIATTAQPLDCERDRSNIPALLAALSPSGLATRPELTSELE